MAKYQLCSLDSNICSTFFRTRIDFHHLASVPIMYVFHFVFEVVDELWQREEGFDEELVKENDKETSYIKCMYTNLRSINNEEKKKELRCILADKIIDALGITESCTTDEVEDSEIKMPGYQRFMKDRKRH